MQLRTYEIGHGGDRFLITDRVCQTDLWRLRMERPEERHTNLLLSPFPYPSKLNKKNNYEATRPKYDQNISIPHGELIISSKSAKNHKARPRGGPIGQNPKGSNIPTISMGRSYQIIRPARPSNRQSHNNTTDANASLSLK